METNNDRADDEAIDVRCIASPEGVLDVVIRTITDEELDRLLYAPRRAPKRVH
jgi:hypothetical protein